MSLKHKSQRLITQKSKKKAVKISPKVVDLFAGAGGLSCGLNAAGFQSIFACEYVNTYAATYQFNHPETVMHVGNIKELTGKRVLEVTGLKRGELDLLAGGPPCQGFSINAPVRTIEDERNQLVGDLIRLADKLLPKFILIENVTGIISLDNGKIIELIYNKLQKLGYQVHHKILFAGHYGVPQIRFRTIFLASRIGVLPEFPAPTHYAKAHINFAGGKSLCIELGESQAKFLKPHSTIKDAISDLPKLGVDRLNETNQYNSNPDSELQKELRKDNTVIYNHQSSRIGKINIERLKYIPQGGSWRDIPEELLPVGLKRARKSDHTKRYGRLHPDGLCSTVLTKCDPHWGSFFHPYEDRIISVREAARIQSFPDRYQFFGSLTEQYAQVGNAVPPLMARAIGQKIIEVLDE